ncbi:hypothetical protein WJX72_001649 [[Myrmecia] bisecta]|uniref:Uncharacterized protein n=1 Tax=[Myrmecia] bisecta TaxID=41462 RepID=A0AAW1P747_9CHLO
MGREDAASCQVFCLDNSECALLSEDYPGSNTARMLSAVAACQSGEGCNLVAALRLALLCSRGSAGASCRLTAFVASEITELSAADQQDLASRLIAAHAALDLICLAPIAEFGPKTAASLEAFITLLNGETSSGSAPLSSAAVPMQSSSTSAALLNRLILVNPPPEHWEPWQHMEALLELLELPPCPMDASVQQHMDPWDDSPRPAAHGQPGRRLLRRQRAARLPALLQQRSGIVTPAMCRHESLDSLMHLSSDGCMRSWLPTYANLPNKPKDGPPRPLRLVRSGQDATQCYVRVFPVDLPKWHCLLEVNMGRMVVDDSPSAAASAEGQDTVMTPAEEDPAEAQHHCSAAHSETQEHYNSAHCPDWQRRCSGGTFGDSGHASAGSILVVEAPTESPASELAEGVGGLFDPLFPRPQQAQQRQRWFFWLQQRWPAQRGPSHQPADDAP